MSLEPARYNFKLWRGATFQYRMTYLTEGPGSDPFDLTGYTAEFAITVDRGTPLLTLTTGNGITLGGTAGTIDLQISNTVTSTLAQAYADHELSLTSPAGVVDTLLYGHVTITGI